MILVRETDARRVLEALHAGMQCDIEPSMWPAVRAALVAQATVWESEGVGRKAAMLRAEIARHDAGGPRTQTGMVPEPLERH